MRRSRSTIHDHLHSKPEAPLADIDLCGGGGCSGENVRHIAWQSSVFGGTIIPVFIRIIEFPRVLRHLSHVLTLYQSEMCGGGTEQSVTSTSKGQSSDMAKCDSIPDVTPFLLEALPSVCQDAITCKCGR